MWHDRLRRQQQPEEIAYEIANLASSIKSKKNEVIVSSIILRKDRVYHRVKVTLRKAFKSFKKDHASIKISQMTFEQLRPKHIRLRRYNQRLQCCCTYHTNVDNETLVSSVLCSPNSIKCIMRICQTCKSFPKTDALDISSLRCGKTCIEENKDCSEHKIKVNQFEYVTSSNINEVIRPVLNFLFFS